MDFVLPSPKNPLILPLKKGSLTCSSAWFPNPTGNKG